MQWYLCIGGYHFKVVEAVAGVETSTIAWLALPARLIIIIIIDEKYDEDEDDDEDDLVTNKVFAGLQTFLTVRAMCI